MKYRTYLAAMALLASLTSATITLAQNSTPAPPPPPPPTHVEDFTVDTGPQLHQELAQAQLQLEHQIAQVRHSTGEVARNAVATARLHANLIQPGAMNRSSQTLLIRTRDLDSESQSQLEEDLNVMSRIVEKAAQSEPTRGPRAMGIDLVFGPGGSPVRSLYLDGYGALFMVNVNFPLLPAPAPDEEALEETSSDTESTWEQTRQEIYGAPRPPEPILAFGWNPENPEGQAYDAAKVDRLRQSLFEAVKNATNIRQLSADESIIVCVLGAPPAGEPHVQALRRQSSSEGPGTERYTSKSREEEGVEEIVVEHRELRDDSTGASRAVMTLQAKKADIDRFARGELTPEQFREVTRTQTYPAGDGWNTPNALFWSNR